MRTLPIVLSVGLAGLTACSIISKGKDSVGGGASDKLGDAAGEAAEDSPVSDVPGLEADDDDPPHVVGALRQLDDMEKNIKDRDWERYARESRSFNNVLLLKDGWKGEKKHGKIKKRMAALDAAAFKAFGGRVAKLVGNGKRILDDADPDAVEAAVAAVAACDAATSIQTTGRGEAKNDLAKAMKAYDKAVRRALKMDERAFRFYVNLNDDRVDVATEILECESRLAAVGDQFGDEYEPEVAPKSEVVVACGSMRWLAGGIQTGAGSFAPYERIAGGAEYAQKIPCKQLKKKSKFPKSLKTAVAQFKEYYEVKDVVFVTEGAPYVEEDDEDLRLWKYQVLMAYSKEFTFPGNPCGGTDEKLFCEAGGSKGARAYNEMEHHLDRARFHAGRAPDRCKQHLKDAVRNWEGFSAMMEEMKKSKEWIGGATYRTKKGEKLKEKDFVASFEEKAGQADEQLTEKYCAKAKSGAGKKTGRASKGTRDDEEDDDDDERDDEEDED
jgi:hypothetical protein